MPNELGEGQTPPVEDTKTAELSALSEQIGLVYVELQKEGIRLGLKTSGMGDKSREDVDAKLRAIEERALAIVGSIVIDENGSPHLLN